MKKHERNMKLILETTGLGVIGPKNHNGHVFKALNLDLDAVGHGTSATTGTWRASRDLKLGDWG